MCMNWLVLLKLQNLIEFYMFGLSGLVLVKK